MLPNVSCHLFPSCTIHYVGAMYRAHPKNFSDWCCWSFCRDVVHDIDLLPAAAADWQLNKYWALSFIDCNDRGKHGPGQTDESVTVVRKSQKCRTNKRVYCFRDWLCHLQCPTLLLQEQSTINLNISGCYGWGKFWTHIYWFY